ncbi:MAG: TetR/AcrR family transcriptional regulator [Gluconacetobacter diazotrophicus]|nr:TetR/AcrR family transcriptional regulator [Gluconacetobacter diazotrophicus]
MKEPASGDPPGERDVRARILAAASGLIATGGLAALTTRAVAAAAGVQAPTLYRLFGEKRGLLDAVAERGMAAFVAGKLAAEPHADAVQDLRAAWDAFVAFGTGNPAVFAIMNEVGAAAPRSPAVLAGLAVLRTRVRRIAMAGRLRLPVEHAVALIHAAGVGTVTTLLNAPDGERDPHLSAIAREAVLAAVTNGPSERNRDSVSLAVGLRAHLDGAAELTPGERLLLGELLDRMAAAPPAAGTAPERQPVAEDRPDRRDAAQA